MLVPGNEITLCGQDECISALFKPRLIDYFACCSRHLCFWLEGNYLQVDAWVYVYECKYGTSILNVLIDQQDKVIICWLDFNNMCYVSSEEISLWRKDGDWTAPISKELMSLLWNLVFKVSSFLKTKQWLQAVLSDLYMMYLLKHAFAHIYTLSKKITHTHTHTHTHIYIGKMIYMYIHTYEKLYIYVVHSINFQTFLYRHLKLL